MSNFKPPLQGRRRRRFRPCARHEPDVSITEAARILGASKSAAAGLATRCGDGLRVELGTLVESLEKGRRLEKPCVERRRSRPVTKRPFILIAGDEDAGIRLVHRCAGRAILAKLLAAARDHFAPLVVIRLGKHVRGLDVFERGSLLEHVPPELADVENHLPELIGERIDRTVDSPAAYVIAHEGETVVGFRFVAIAEETAANPSTLSIDGVSC